MLQVKGRGVWLPVAVVLCLLSLLASGVVQAAHAHDAPISLQAGKHALLAPADECPLCAATHAAMPASAELVVHLLPRAERLAVNAGRAQAAVQRWSYELFSRPPPARQSTRI